MKLKKVIKIVIILNTYIIGNEGIKLANLNSRLIFSIFSVVLFSILILHTKFYIHHFFSIVIDIICDNFSCYRY